MVVTTVLFVILGVLILYLRKVDARRAAVTRHLPPGFGGEGLDNGNDEYPSEGPSSSPTYLSFGVASASLVGSSPDKPKPKAKPKPRRKLDVEVEDSVSASDVETKRTRRTKEEVTTVATTPRRSRRGKSDRSLDKA